MLTRDPGGQGLSPFGSIRRRTFSTIVVEQDSSGFRILLAGGGFLDSIPVEVHLVATSSGNLLEHLMAVALTQFAEGSIRVSTHPFVHSSEEIDRVVAGAVGGLIVHALADPSLKEAMRRACEARGVSALDGTEPLIRFLEESGGIERWPQPRPVHRVDESYLERMDALEFTMQHDDSRRIEELDRAEIVLVGLSRVSKSPVSLFLAYRGFRVSNVAVVPSHGLPPELAAHSQPNVIALTIQPRRLSEIRTRRFAAWQMREGFDYSDMRAVIREVMEAESLYKAQGWPLLDTTGLAVEETAARVVQTLGLRPKEFN